MRSTHWRIQSGRRRLSGAVDRIRLGDTRFCTVSDDCWGADLYRHVGRAYNTPFVGLFVKSEAYLRLLGDLRSYLAEPLAFRDQPGESRGVRYPVGVLGDVDIHFLHYAAPAAAESAWCRRLERFNFDHLAVKFRATVPPPRARQVERFLALPYERKVVFCTSPLPGTVHVPNWRWDNAFAESRRAFDVVGWLKAPARS
jgi:uncharacterized protein (DUF1919 family)